MSTLRKDREVAENEISFSFTVQSFLGDDDERRLAIADDLHLIELPVGGTCSFTVNPWLKSGRDSIEKLTGRKQ